MNIFFVVILVGFVLLMLIFNVYFRYKILGDYRLLVKNKIEFGTRHIFNADKLEQEIIPNYPDHKELIRSFCGKIRNSFRIAIALILLIILIAFIIKYFLV